MLLISPHSKRQPKQQSLSEKPSGAPLPSYCLTSAKKATAVSCRFADGQRSHWEKISISSRETSWARTRTLHEEHKGQRPVKWEGCRLPPRTSPPPAQALLCPAQSSPSTQERSPAAVPLGAATERKVRCCPGALTSSGGTCPRHKCGGSPAAPTFSASRTASASSSQRICSALT